MSTCEKINCGYYYQTEEDDFPCCHFDINSIWAAPCEYDDEDDPEEDEKALEIFLKNFSKNY